MVRRGGARRGQGHDDYPQRLPGRSIGETHPHLDHLANASSEGLT